MRIVEDSQSHLRLRGNFSLFSTSLCTIRIARDAPNALSCRDIEHAAARLCVVLSGVFQEEASRLSQINRPGQLLYRPADMPHAERFDGKGALSNFLQENRRGRVLRFAKALGFDAEEPFRRVAPRVPRRVEI